MPEPAVHFESVWKKFQRGEHHVSFDVRPGETLGIIGGNGAGKSTILKLLTRIMRPNRGTLHVEGRVGALIEVSAGFHPDLTGRENIFLQGSLMGMRNATIEQKFDEIVEFSGISEFLDTPVKRYSSGMNARLGFSIAAHLDPDVLIIDEVLAVGDFRFQQRAFGRLQELAKSGRPVVVVSHQLDRIAELCSKAVLLSSGQVHTAGSPSECIAAYLEHAGAGTNPEKSPVTFLAPRLAPGGVLSVGDAFTFAIRVVCRQTLPDDLIIGIRVRLLSEASSIFGTNLTRQKISLPRARQFELSAELRAHLIPGRYVVDAYAVDPRNLNEVWASPGLPLNVLGDQSRYGRAHLGGMLNVITEDGGVAVASRND
jgi:ABC-type polysaccharide/polyol phosphate transport system ATPase subunit